MKLAFPFAAALLLTVACAQKEKTADIDSATTSNSAFWASENASTPEPPTPAPAETRPVKKRKTKTKSDDRKGGARNRYQQEYEK